MKVSPADTAGEALRAAEADAGPLPAELERKLRAMLATAGAVSWMRASNSGRNLRRKLCMGMTAASASGQMVNPAMPSQM